MSDVLPGDFETEDGDDVGFYQQGCEFLRLEIAARDARIAELVGLLEEVANAPTQIRCECPAWPDKYVVTLTADQDARIRAALAAPAGKG